MSNGVHGADRPRLWVRRMTQTRASIVTPPNHKRARSVLQRVNVQCASPLPRLPRAFHHMSCSPHASSPVGSVYVLSLYLCLAELVVGGEEADVQSTAALRVLHLFE